MRSQHKTQLLYDAFGEENCWNTKYPLIFHMGAEQINLCDYKEQIY